MIASQSEKLVSSIRSQVTSSGYEVVGMASNGYDLIRRCKALAPAVVIVDEELPGMRRRSFPQMWTPWQRR